MFSWLQTNKPSIINFETVQYAMKFSHEYIIINVLGNHEQYCLISGTIEGHQEESILTSMFNNISVPDKKIIIYGKNCNYDKILEKANQLREFGVTEIFLYRGGLFEWMLLQDIYGSDSFPTTKNVRDLLKYKPQNISS